MAAASCANTSATPALLLRLPVSLRTLHVGHPISCRFLVLPILKGRESEVMGAEVSRGPTNQPGHEGARPRDSKKGRGGFGKRIECLMFGYILRGRIGLVLRKVQGRVEMARVVLRIRPTVHRFLSYLPSRQSWCRQVTDLHASSGCGTACP